MTAASMQLTAEEGERLLEDSVRAERIRILETWDNLVPGLERIESELKLLRQIPVSRYLLEQELRKRPIEVLTIINGVLVLRKHWELSTSLVTAVPKMSYWRSLRQGTPRHLACHNLLRADGIVVWRVHKNDGGYSPTRPFDISKTSPVDRGHLQRALVDATRVTGSR